MQDFACGEKPRALGVTLGFSRVCSPSASSLFLCDEYPPSSLFYVANIGGLVRGNNPHIDAQSRVCEDSL
jgi:hypothetical protein